MKEKLPLLELFLSALCLWAAWYHTPAGALVRTAGAFIFGARSTARPLLAYFGAGTLVPPRPPPPLTGPIPPPQALAYGAAAVAAGVVRRASSDGINGRILVLDHGRGVVTTYCHNEALLVRDGQHVERGQVVARSGSSGLTTGPHLHYQIDLAGEPVDPLRFRAQHPKTALGATD